MKLRIKRAYEQADEADGIRVLADRLWPRGLSKERAKIDIWLKEIAPSDALRKWFAHDVSKWAEFQERYAKEVRANPNAVEHLRALAREKKVTLVYAAKDRFHNEAILLQQWFGKT